MRTITTNPDGEYYFSSGIADIEIMQHTGVVTVTINKNGVAVLKDQYVGDNIIVKNLSRSLDPHVDVFQTFHFEITDERSQIIDGTFDVYKAKAFINASPLQLIHGKYMTLHKSPIETSLNGSNYLAHDSAAQYIISLTYTHNTTGNQLKEERIINRTMRQPIDVSPRVFAKTGYTLRSFTVSCNNQLMEYIVAEYRFSRHIIFDNLFGIKDSAIFNFEMKKSDESKRGESYIDRMLVADFEHKSTIKAELTSGSIDRANAGHYRSIAFAKDVELDGIHYIATSATVEETDDSTEMLQCKLELKQRYQYNQLEL